MPTTRYPSRSARIVIARIAGLRPGTSPPPVRIAIVGLLAISQKASGDRRFIQRDLTNGLADEQFLGTDGFRPNPWRRSEELAVDKVDYVVVHQERYPPST